MVKIPITARPSTSTRPAASPAARRADRQQRSRPASSILRLARTPAGRGARPRAFSAFTGWGQPPGGSPREGLGRGGGGSVRAPASFCGIYGLRPTHGRIPLEGACALAWSFDVAGPFARDAALLERVGRVLLRDDEPAPRAGPLLYADDAFALVDSAVK